MRRVIRAALLVLCCTSCAVGQGTSWGLTGTVEPYAALQLPAPNAWLSARTRATLNLRLDTGWGRLYLANRLTTRLVDRPLYPLLQYEIREGYLDWYTDRVDFRIGQQQIVWGEADGAFITDLWSPLDLTSFLTQAFTDLRRGVPAVQATGYFGPWSVTGVWMPIHVSTLLPRTGASWNVLPASLGEVAVRVRPQDTPAFALKNGEAALRVSYEGLPLTTVRAMYGYGWHRLPALVKQPVLGGGALQVAVTPTYYRRHAAGVSFSSAWLAPWILRGEMSVQTRVAFDVGVTPAQIEAPDLADPVFVTDLANGFVRWKPYTQVMLGAERSWGTHVVRVQGLGSLIHGHTPRIVQAAWVPALTVLWLGQFRRETLQVQAFAYVNPTRDYWFNPALTLALRDGLSATLGLHIFGGATGSADPAALSFALFDQLDLVYLGLKYSF